jgi:hypothetical protein
MGFTRVHSRSVPVEKPILLYFLICLSTIYSARKADGPGQRPSLQVSHGVFQLTGSALQDGFSVPKLIH